MFPKTWTSTVLSNSHSYIQYVWSLPRTFCCPWGASYGHSSKPRTWTSIFSSRYGTSRTAKGISDLPFRSIVTTRSSRSKYWTGMFKSSIFFQSGRFFFTCWLLDAIHSYFLSVVIFSFKTRASTSCILCYLSYKNLRNKKSFPLFNTAVVAIVNYRIYFIYYFYFL